MSDPAKFSSTSPRSDKQLDRRSNSAPRVTSRQALLVSAGGASYVPCLIPRMLEQLRAAIWKPGFRPCRRKSGSTMSGRPASRNLSQHTRVLERCLPLVGSTVAPQVAPTPQTPQIPSPADTPDPDPLSLQDHPRAGIDHHPDPPQTPPQTTPDLSPDPPLPLTTPRPPRNPGPPDTPDTPDTPETPDTPDSPDTPDTPDPPETPDPPCNVRACPPI